MKTSRPHLTLSTFAREFSDAPSPKFNGMILSPAHPPCWCIKPSDIPVEYELFADLREEEKFYSKRGSTLWFVVYKYEPELRSGFLLSPSSNTQPTPLELSRHFNWLAGMNWLAIQTENGCIHDMDSFGFSSNASGGK